MRESARILRRVAAQIREYAPAVAFEVLQAADTLEHFDADMNRRIVEMDAILLLRLVGYYFAGKAQDSELIAEFARLLVQRVDRHPLLFSLFEKPRDEALAMTDNAQEWYAAGRIDTRRFRATGRIREALR